MARGSRIEFLGGAGNGVPSQEAWQTPTLLNNWVNYGVLDEAAQYFKDSFGVIHLKGAVKNGTIAQPIFQLPAGYRPVLRNNFPVVSNSAFAFVQVTSGGDVTCHAGNNTWVSLSGITFRVA